MRFEKAGIPAVLFATSSFIALARTVSSSLGVEDLRIIEVDHPLGGISKEALAARVDSAQRQLTELLQVDA